MIKASEKGSVYSEVWELDSLKKIGGHSVGFTGNPQIVNTGNEKAMRFNGIIDKLLVDNNPIADAKEYTVEVIFKPDPAFEISKEPRFIHFQDPDDPLSKRVLIELRLTQNNEWYLDGFMQTDAGEKTLVDETMTHAVGEWMHAAVTYKNNVLKTFVNGVQELTGEVGYSNDLINKMGKTSIGGRMDNRNYYCGLIKTLKITRKALTPEEFIKLPKNK